MSDYFREEISIIRFALSYINVLWHKFAFLFFIFFLLIAHSDFIFRDIKLEISTHFQNRGKNVLETSFKKFLICTFSKWVEMSDLITRHADHSWSSQIKEMKFQSAKFYSIIIIFFNSNPNVKNYWSTFVLILKSET